MIISASKMASVGISVHQKGFASRIPISAPKRRRLPPSSFQPPIRINCSAIESGNRNEAEERSSSQFKEFRSVVFGILATWAVTAASPVIAASQRLPPLSTEPNRCERAFVGNTIGQANGVYDKPIDLRYCDYTNDKSNLKGKSLAAALMSNAKFDGADLSEVVMSKAYAVGASFKGVDFSNAVLDRVNFEKANLQGALFKNTVLSGSTFDNAQLQDAVFEDTIIGYIDLQKLCTNQTIGAEVRLELGCR
ncbi:Thylakoid lumenal 17.4 kDa protein, chloroplastic [Ancistrocladus abbreviatus]